MAWNNRVLWSEGLFLQPHHFQQHDRWLEHLALARTGIGMPYPWGLNYLSIDHQPLALGKLVVTGCAGILPDGTPFQAPASDPLPPPLQLGTDSASNPAGQTIYLALPLASPGAPESGARDARNTTLRYRAGEELVRDNCVGPETEAAMEVGLMDLRLMTDADARDGFACIGIARVLEVRADGQVLLDDAYIPPCIDFQASGRLTAFVDELQGLLHRQGDSRAARVRGASQGGVSDWGDFLLLQLINRASPVAIHFGRTRGLHPEALYRWLLGVAGDLATLADDAKRPPDFPPYRHDDLDPVFTPLIDRLRVYLSRERIERAIHIPIQDRQYGFRLALVPDASLFRESRFVLAGKAQIESQKLRNLFPTQIKIGPLNRIADLVKRALPGVVLRPMPTAPQEIPYHAGFDYFELESSGELWKEIAAGGGFGLHVGGDFPGLELELWAIRE